jgi:hypothetical protein
LRQSRRRPKKHLASAAASAHPFNPYPDYRTITIAPMTGQTDLGALHGFLFDCAPENLINLTAEQRAGCVTANAGPKPDDSVDYADHTNRSKNAVRWARGLMRKQQPLLLPCMPPGLATLICLGKGISGGGFDLDMQPSYGDKPRGRPCAQQWRSAKRAARLGSCVR